MSRAEEHEAEAVERLPPSSRSTAELTGDLARQVTNLVHHEVELAGRELQSKGRRAGFGAGLFGAAAMLGLVALGCLAACAIAALHLRLALWLSALVVGGFLLLVAAALALLGGGELRRAVPAAPMEAIEQTKEDVAWIKRHARFGTR